MPFIEQNNKKQTNNDANNQSLQVDCVPFCSRNLDMSFRVNCTALARRPLGKFGGSSLLAYFIS